MCLLSISTGKFLLVAFVALCVYELGVFLYFRFVKGNDSSVSKNESRKRRERVQDSPKPKPETRTATSKRGKEPRHKDDMPDWEDLIDYRKTSRASTLESVSGMGRRQSSVIDVFSPADTHADFSRMDELSRQSVEDLLGETPSPASSVSEPLHEIREDMASHTETTPTPPETRSVEPSSQQSSTTEPKEPTFDVNSAFMDCDFSNMEG